MKGMNQHSVWPSSKAVGRSRKSWVLVLALSLAFALLGCSQGAYPLDIFSEMHYNQSYKVQEPPSLSAPSDSVPITGRELVYTMAQARQLANPAPKGGASVKRGEALFKVNCVVCHGADAKGTGPMRDKLIAAGYVGQPADLTKAGTIIAKPDGEVYLIITKGYAVAYGFPPASSVMPSFEKLLTENDRWAIIRYLRTLP